MPNNSVARPSGHLGREAHRRPKTSKEERVCSICSQAFKKAEHLERHLRSHTREKPFKCLRCGRVYTREDTLLRHSRSHQTRQETWREPETPVSMEGLDMNYPEKEMGGDIISFQSGSQASQPTITTESITPTQFHAESGALCVSTPSLSLHDTPNISVDTSTESKIHNTPPTPVFSTDCGEDSGNQPGLWDDRLDTEWASWLTGVDFDLEAVNLSLLHATSELFPTSDRVADQSMIGFSEDPDLTTERQPSERQEAHIQRKWHTYSEQTSSGYMTPNASQERRLIDETYRKKLADNLRQQVQHGILPSTYFLDLCIQSYFAHFHPIFPVIHAPSFRPCTRNSVLLLSICSVGSLFLGSPRATAHGISMFERLNKAILASWETYVSKQGAAGITALQATIIGQTFSLLLGRPKDLIGIDVFHGSIISWARKAKIFQFEESDFNVMNLSDDALSAAWKSWIRMEEKKRIVLGLQVHDAELARLHHHEPTLRHSLERLPRISSNELFVAPTTMHWKNLMIQNQVRDPLVYCPRSPIQTVPAPGVFKFPEVSNDFELCVILEAMSALACEDRDSALTWPHTAQRCRELLTLWYEKYHLLIVRRKLNRAGLMILWHSIFMILYADFDTLELACGREGPEATHKALGYAQAWVKTVDAKRCLLHAVLIQRHFESIPIGTEPSIHVPMCLYYCGIILFCYLRFGADGDGDGMGEAEHNLDFSELRLLGVNGNKMIVEETGVLQLGRPGSDPVFKVIDLLQRISHWKIAQSFASTLLALLEDEQDIF